MVGAVVSRIILMLVVAGYQPVFDIDFKIVYAFGERACWLACWRHSRQFVGVAINTHACRIDS